MTEASLVRPAPLDQHHATGWAMKRAAISEYKQHFSKFIESPVGRLRLVGTDDALAAVLWPNDNPRRVRLPVMVEAPSHALLVVAETQLDEYFAGERTTFDLPLDLVGTDFQRNVWNGLLDIPFGETRSYGQLAEQIGHAGAVRAVGAANGRNPISIIVPCHRVIGSTGKLTGFAGGLPAKARLLALEGARGEATSIY